MVETTGILVRGIAALLVLGGTALLPRAAQAVDVIVADGLVTIDADAVPLHEILEALVAQDALRLIAFRAVDRPVTARLRRVPLADALQRLLGGSERYQLFSPAAAGDPAAVTVTPTLWIFDDASGPAFALDFYATILGHGGVGDKTEAIRALRDIATPDALRVLAGALNDPDQRVRHAARDALAAVGDADALAVLDGTPDAAGPVPQAEAADARAPAGGATADAAPRTTAFEAVQQTDDAAMFRALFPEPQPNGGTTTPRNLR